MTEYIDRDKAIEVCDWYEHEYSECEDYIRTIAEDIRRLPAADVVKRVYRRPRPSDEMARVRHGRWECETPHVYACSLCGYEPWYWKSINTIHYCPNCGALMDQEVRE